MNIATCDSVKGYFLCFSPLVGTLFKASAMKGVMCDVGVLLGRDLSRPSGRIFTMFALVGTLFKASALLRMLPHALLALLSSRAGNAPCRFNPRTHAGCDKAAGMVRIISIKFQSTHPRGVRPIRFFSNLNHGTFQSTHPRGVRLIMIAIANFI